jgi:hypothetical protein
MKPMNDKLKLIEYGLGEEEDNMGVYAVSLVSEPAIMVDFVALSKQSLMLARVEDGEKRMLYGPALIPNQPIVRYDGNNEKYYITYTKETIEQTAQEFLKRNMHHNHTIQHEMPVNNLTVVESWVTMGAHDKSMNLGFELPEGTWMIGVKVDDDKTWEAVKNGEVKGFSIEGWFTPMAETEVKEKDLEKLLAELAVALEMNL